MGIVTTYSSGTPPPSDVARQPTPTVCSPIWSHHHWYARIDVLMVSDNYALWFLLMHVCWKLVELPITLEVVLWNPRGRSVQKQMDVRH